MSYDGSNDIELSDEAEDLLDSLRGGDGSDIAVPSVYPGVEAFCDHAQAYFNNAAMLCRAGQAHDFAVFGALYCMRHGLELWLKWTIQTQLMRAVVDAISEGRTFEEVVDVALTGCEGKKKRDARRQHFIKALCVVRNVDNGVHRPRCWQVDIGETFARERVAKGRVPRSHLEIVWPIPIDGHDLRALWKDAERYVRDRYRYARESSMMSGVGDPMPPERIGALCELLGKWDPGGDGFRYPVGLDGRWYIELPSLNLRSLAELADALESTVLAYKAD